MYCYSYVNGMVTNNLGLSFQYWIERREGGTKESDLIDNSHCFFLLQKDNK